MSTPNADAGVEAARALLPPEFRSFLESPLPQSATIRGAPGVGKTTFALGALAGFRGERILVSTRVPVPAIRRQFPWLDRLPGPPVELMDFARTPASLATGGLSVDRLRQSLQARASDLVDVSHVLSLPAPLQEVLDRAAPGPRLIAVDSWEAWVENALGSSALALDTASTRWELERSILDIFLGAGASVLLVVEREERTRFDYVTDGVLVLSSNESEGREERWIDLAKLRGVPLRSRSYPFTLEGARFRALVGVPSGVGRPPAHAEPDPDPSAETLWPGSSTLATQFGRLPSLGPTLLEADAETPIRTLWTLVAPVIESSIRAGGHVVLRAPGIVGAREIWSSFLDPLSSDALRSSLRVVLAAGGPRTDDLPREVFLPEALEPGGAGGGPGPASETAGLGTLADHIVSNAGAGAKNLIVIFASTPAESGAGSATDPYLRLPPRTRRAGGAFSAIFVVRSDDPGLNEARARASAHLAVRIRRGQVFVYGVRPWSPYLVYRPGSPGASSPYELIAIV